MSDPLARLTAVKMLKPELAVAIGAERFLAEIKTTANLQHPRILALHDSGEVNVAGDNYGVMLRRTDGSPAVRLGEGAVLAMSRDKQWVLSALPSVPVKLMLYPTGAGVARRLDHGEFVAITKGAFVGDGSEILICGNEPKRAVRCHVKPSP